MRKSKRMLSSIEVEIEKVLEEMTKMDSDSGEYQAARENLVELYKLKDIESGGKVKKDTIVGGLLTIAGIGVIVVAEQSGTIMNSRALGFVRKPK